MFSQGHEGKKGGKESKYTREEEYIKVQGMAEDIVAVIENCESKIWCYKMCDVLSRKEITIDWLCFCFVLF